MRRIHSFFSGGLLALLTLIMSFPALAESEYPYTLSILAVDQDNNDILAKKDTVLYSNTEYSLDEIVEKATLLKGLTDSYFPDRWNRYTEYSNESHIGYNSELKYTTYSNTRNGVVIINLHYGIQVNMTVMFNNEKVAEKSELRTPGSTGSPYEGVSLYENTVGQDFKEGGIASISINGEITYFEDLPSSYEEDSYYTLPDKGPVDLVFYLTDKNKFDLTINAVKDGTTTQIDKKSEINYGSDFNYSNISIPTFEGYHIKSITLDGKDVKSKFLSEYDGVRMPMHDATLSVSYAPNSNHNLTINVNKCGETAQVTESNIASGSIIAPTSFNALSSLLKEESFTISVNGSEPVETWDFTMPEEDAVVDVNVTSCYMEETEYDLSVKTYMTPYSSTTELVNSGKTTHTAGKVQNGQTGIGYYSFQYIINISDIADFTYVERLNGSLTASEYFYLSYVVVNGVTYSPEEEWEMPAEDAVLELYYADYDSKKLYIFSDADEHASISVDRTKAAASSSITATVTTDEGYVCKGLSVKGDDWVRVRDNKDNTYTVMFSYNPNDNVIILTADVAPSNPHKAHIFATLNGAIIGKTDIDLETDLQYSLKTLLEKYDLNGGADNLYITYNCSAVDNDGNAVDLGWDNDNIPIVTMPDKDVTIHIDLATGTLVNASIFDNDEKVTEFSTLLRDGQPFMLENVRYKFLEYKEAADLEKAGYNEAFYVIDDNKIYRADWPEVNDDYYGLYAPLPEKDHVDISVYYTSDKQFVLIKKAVIDNIEKESADVSANGGDIISTSDLSFATDLTGYSIASASLNGQDVTEKLLLGELAMPFENATLVVSYTTTKTKQLTVKLVETSDEGSQESQHIFESVVVGSYVDIAKLAEANSTLPIMEKIRDLIINHFKEGYGMSVKVDDKLLDPTDDAYFRFQMPDKDVTVVVSNKNETAEPISYELTAYIYIDDELVNIVASSASEGKFWNEWVGGYETVTSVLLGINKDIADACMTAEEQRFSDIYNIESIVFNDKNVNTGDDWKMPAKDSDVSIYFTSGTKRVSIYTDLVLGGTISADKLTAYDKSKVTITVTPDKGYTLESISVDGDNAALVKNNDGTYTYVVSDNAASTVLITATFLSDGSDATFLTATAADDFNVSVDDKSINVSGADKFSVYDLSGREIAADATGSVRVAAAGLYVVTSGDKSAKVLVK
ncbi:MAG: hypothetical protein II951_09875 [Bacteroidales bacterium]|nr:hypothetical protein [Bacteroidales bacterium]